MFTINQLAKQFGLSRSTLLYYDKIGLLSPSARSSANYRLYSTKDQERMAKIATFREAGLALETIQEMLAATDSKASEVLEQRLMNLNDEIHQLRQQQQLVVQLLGKDSLLRQAKTMSKDQWVNILRASGMDDEAMHRWHIEFERDLPQVHSDFLASLGCSEKEISDIRAWSKAR